MAITRSAITHVAPDEAQGHARSPNFSDAHVASGFSWGIRQKAQAGVYNIPGAGANTVSENVGFGPGFQKP